MTGAVTVAIPNLGRRCAIDAFNPFSRYKPETSRAIVNQKVKENETLKKLKETFQRYKLHGEVKYETAPPLVRKLRYSPKDIGAFSIALSEFHDDKEFEFGAGYFLSALVNNCGARDFTIITQHLREPLSQLGSRNIKNVTIYGNVGDGIGYDMKRGNITVKGDAKGWAGAFMKGGTLVVEGNVENLVGEGMTGGIISLKGRYGTIGYTIPGGNSRVYHKGKLIVRRGTKLEGLRVYRGGKLIAENEKRVI